MLRGKKQQKLHLSGYILNLNFIFFKFQFFFEKSLNNIRTTDFTYFSFKKKTHFVPMFIQMDPKMREWNKDLVGGLHLTWTTI